MRALWWNCPGFESGNEKDVGGVPNPYTTMGVAACSYQP